MGGVPHAIDLPGLTYGHNATVRDHYHVSMLSRSTLEARVSALEHEVTAARRALEIAQQNEQLAVRSARDAWALVQMLRGSSITSTRSTSSAAS